jgi:hypothetical protein
MRNSPETKRDRTVARVAAVAGAAGALLVGSACGGPEVVEHRRVRVEQHVQAPAPMTDILITDLHEIPAPSATEERVTGTIVNRGDKPVSMLTIRVDALDDRGRIVDSITTPPLDQTIAALGGQATFEATLRRSPETVSYHAVAIAR